MIEMVWIFEEIGSYSIPKVILKCNSESSKRKGKPRKQCMDGVRRTKISKDLTEDYANQI